MKKINFPRFGGILFAGCVLVSWVGLPAGPFYVIYAYTLYTTIYMPFHSSITLPL